MAQLSGVLVVAAILRGSANAVVGTGLSTLWTVVANRPYTVEWEDAFVGLRGSNHDVDVDLYYCDSVCAEDECGTWVADLCAHDDASCTPIDGILQVVMPEPTHGTSWGYKVRVTSPRAPRTKSVNGCSDQFKLIASGEALSAGELDRPFLEVISPKDGDLALVGVEYTVQFVFDHGASSKNDLFVIDLYMAGGGSGDCGVWVGSLCNGPGIGCKGAGDGGYDVTIPLHAQPGYYSIRVGRLRDNSRYDCSGVFEVVSRF